MRCVHCVKDRAFSEKSVPSVSNVVIGIKLIFLQTVRAEAGTLAGIEAKLCELTQLIRDLPGQMALANSSDGRLSQQWNRPRTTNGGYQVSLTLPRAAHLLKDDSSRRS
jgi:hypothetical protein